ncbi:MAG: TIGR03915 family putative DNA repair protein [Treponema sp.]|jgi:hypothetical protein|nr:TIGR03915 family putative DNA repair protein [Treponema sp.]
MKTDDNVSSGYDLSFAYDGTLEGFFALLDRLWNGALPEERWPRRVLRSAAPGGGTQGLLFDEGPLPAASPAEAPVPPALLPEAAVLGPTAGILFQVSAEAYDALVCVWMSGLPLEGAALRYALRVLGAAKRAAAASGPASAPAAGRPWYCREEARHGAAGAARNRADEDCRTVLALSYKVAHEIDRLMGFLRFSPDVRGRYVARCAPDYRILPALAPHFSERFGDAPWAIVDEKRGLVLAGEGRGELRLSAIEAAAGPKAPGTGDCAGPSPQGRSAPEPWEELWRSYHRAVNIDDRKNLSLQRRFVPLRYRDYLDEFSPSVPPSTGDCN